MGTKPNWEIESVSAKRFGVKFAYDPDTIAAMKSAGGTWNAGAKRWTFPKDLSTVNEVTDVGRRMGVNFVIAPEFKKWVQAERKRIRDLISPDDISQATDDLLPHTKAVHPTLWNALRSRPFQLLGAEFIARQRNVLMADQPGMGKTIQTLAAIIENDIKGMILVIAPRTAAAVTWPAEIKRWIGPDEVIYNINGKQKPDERAVLLKEAISLRRRGHRVWCIMGPNYARAKADLDSQGNYKRDSKGNKIIRVVNEGRPELFSIEWEAIIVDESHQTLAGATGNLKTQSAQRFGLGLLRTKDDGMRIALSGTPFRGKIHYMWGQIDWLEPDRRPAYWRWVERHLGTTDNGFGTVINSALKDEEAFYLELKPIMVRRTKTEVVKDLPSKMYGGELFYTPEVIPKELVINGSEEEIDEWYATHNQEPNPIAVWLPMTPKQESQYKKMEASALLQIKEEPDMPVNGILAEMVRLKQIANGVVDLNADEIVDATEDSNKLNWIMEFLEERLGDPSQKVIIASQFTKFIYMISKALTKADIGHYLLTGRQNDAERKAAQEGFQSDGGPQVFLLNTKAGGVSLTLDKADDVVICDSTFNPDDQEQVEDRAHRVSRMHSVTIWNLASRGTIDEHIWRLTAEREAATKGIIDGQRGIAFTKQLAEAMREKATGKAA